MSDQLVMGHAAVVPTTGFVAPLSPQPLGQLSVPCTDWHCPVHGNVGPQTFHSAIKGKEGVWCLYCIVELVDKHCQRVMRMEVKP